MTLTQHQRDLAAQIGSDAGTAAAGWAWDGNNSTPERAARCIALSDDGDPEWYDDFGNQPWLSGEWTDSDTPTSVATECGLEEPEFDSDTDDEEIFWVYATERDELSDLYETAADAAYETEVLRQAHVIVDDGAI
jgi:hypothetical protein